MIDDLVGASASGDSAGIRKKLVQVAETAVDKTTFVYTLRLLSTHGTSVNALVKLAQDYNNSRARPEYMVDKFVIEHKGDFSQVDVETGKVSPKPPYPTLPTI